MEKLFCEMQRDYRQLEKNLYIEYKKNKKDNTMYEFFEQAKKRLSGCNRRDFFDLKLTYEEMIILYDKNINLRSESIIKTIGSHFLSAIPIMVSIIQIMLVGPVLEVLLVLEENGKKNIYVDILSVVKDFISLGKGILGIMFAGLIIIIFGELLMWFLEVINKRQDANKYLFALNMVDIIKSIEKDIF